jgi:hypothetical protein
MESMQLSARRSSRDRFRSEHGKAGLKVEASVNEIVPSRKSVVGSILASPLVRAKLLFLLASFASLILSVSLWFSGNEMQGLFVGIWVPSILSAGSLILSGNQP